MIKGFVKGQTELISKQKYPPPGSDEPFSLIAYRDPALFLVRDFKIQTDPNDDSTKLLEGTHYHFEIDILYSTSDFMGEQVASKVAIHNPNYQNLDLYITYRWVADYASDEMMNRFDRGLDQMINSIVTTVDSNVVVSNNGNVIAQGEKYPGYRETL